MSFCPRQNSVDNRETVCHMFVSLCYFLELFFFLYHLMYAVCLIVWWLCLIFLSVYPNATLLFISIPFVQGNIATSVSFLILALYSCKFSFPCSLLCSSQHFVFGVAVCISCALNSWYTVIVDFLSVFLSLDNIYQKCYLPNSLANFSQIWTGSSMTWILS